MVAWELWDFGTAEMPQTTQNLCTWNQKLPGSPRLSVSMPGRLPSSLKIWEASCQALGSLSNGLLNSWESGCLGFSTAHHDSYWRARQGKKAGICGTNLSAFRQTLVEIETNLPGILVLTGCPHVMTFKMWWHLVISHNILLHVSKYCFIENNVCFSFIALALLLFCGYSFLRGSVYFIIATAQILDIVLSYLPIVICYMEQIGCLCQNLLLDELKFIIVFFL